MKIITKYEDLAKVNKGIMGGHLSLEDCVLIGLRLDFSRYYFNNCIIKKCNIFQVPKLKKILIAGKVVFVESSIASPNYPIEIEWFNSAEEMPSVLFNNCKCDSLVVDGVSLHSNNSDFGSLQHVPRDYGEGGGTGGPGVSVLNVVSSRIDNFKIDPIGHHKRLTITSSQVNKLLSNYSYINNPYKLSHFKKALNISYNVWFNSCTFEEVTLDGIDFKNSRFSGSSFSKCIIRNCDFSNCKNLNGGKEKVVRVNDCVFEENNNIGSMKLIPIDNTGYDDQFVLGE